jgi:hypothetical protein
MDKTVYILGAGFSKDLNAPLQSEIMKEIFSLDPEELDYSVRRVFLENKEIFCDFLENVLFISPSGFSEIRLEDIYTPIDRCILENVSFRNVSKADLIELRQKINALIVILFQKKLQNFAQYSYADQFAEYLANLKRNQQTPKDIFSIISLNWDIIFDNALNSQVRKKIDSLKDGVVDYCCYVTSYNKYENILPGLLAKGRNKYNIKLLKLHGSMNWLQCQRCQRLFIAFDEKIAIEEYFSKPKCRLCEKNFSNERNCFSDATLINQLLMPTFLKDINNVQLKLIWQNAGIELSEANKIVFMGYSFPEADYELRQLLSKFVRHSAKIEVVLKYRPRSKKQDSPEKRYRSFFGRRDIDINYSGVKKYIKKLCE